MKRGIAIIVSILLFNLLACQEPLSESELSLSTLRNVHVLKVIEDHILVAGYLHNEDEQNNKSSLIKLDKDLQKIWSLDLDLADFNSIDQIAVHRDTIFISGKSGVQSGTDKKDQRFLMLIDQAGSIIKRIDLGRSIGRAANLLFTKNKVTLVYATHVYLELEPTDDANPLIVTEIDLETFANKKRSYISNALPKHLVTFNNQKFLVAERYVSVFPVVLENSFFNIDSSKEKVDNFIPNEDWNTSEVYAGTILNNNKAVIISQSEETRDFPDAYLRYSYLNSSGGLTGEKMVWFADHNWEIVSVFSAQRLKSFWGIVKKRSNENTYYVNLDFNGKLIEEFSTTLELKDLKYFDIDAQYIYQVVQEEESLRLKRIPKI